MISVNLVYWDSGGGIRHDVAIVEKILKSEGFRTRRIITKSRQSSSERLLKAICQLSSLVFPSDIQFHFEQIHREQFLFARKNFLFPNPEFTDPDVFPKLRKPPIILCKTRHAESVLGQISGDHHFVGFTSNDRYLNGTKKNFRKFLHLAGFSEFKGTLRVAQAWARNKHWPKLTIVRSPKTPLGMDRVPLPEAENIELIEEWLDGDRIRLLQNQCGVHVCASEMEGFGHYIVEGLSTGSLVVTTDAQPMNELVKPEYGFLVKARKVGTSFMSDRWIIEQESLERNIDNILLLSEGELRRKERLAREAFLEIDSSFRMNFRRVVLSGLGWSPASTTSP